MKTNIEELDKIIDGLNAGELITIAGRPAVGKSSFVISIINNLSKQISKKILYFNLDSSKENIIDCTNVEIINDVSNIEDIENMINEKYKQGISLVVIDYLQLITTLNGYPIETEEKFYTSRVLKTLALNLNIPIIVVSQLGISIEKREDKRAVLSDIKPFGLQLDSDKIICLYRNKCSSKMLNYIELDIIKNHYGPLGSVIVKLNK